MPPSFPLAAFGMAAKNWAIFFPAIIIAGKYHSYLSKKTLTILLLTIIIVGKCCSYLAKLFAGNYYYQKILCLFVTKSVAFSLTSLVTIFVFVESK